MATSRRGPTRASLAALGAVLRLALFALPLLLLRAASTSRERRLSDLSDRELADIGLARADVERLCGRPRPGPGPLPFEPLRDA